MWFTSISVPFAVSVNGQVEQLQPDKGLVTRAQSLRQATETNRTVDKGERNLEGVCSQEDDELSVMISGPNAATGAIFHPS